MEDEGGSRSGSLLQRLLAGACMTPAGVVLESGSSGSLHMTLSDDLIRAALRQPLPVSSPAQPLLEPLWDSESGAALSSTLPAFLLFHTSPACSDMYR